MTDKAVRKTNYSSVVVRPHSHEAWLAWYTNDEMGVVVGSKGTSVTTSTLAELISRTHELQITLEDEEPGAYDLDLVEDWLQEPRAETVDCKLLVDAWNLFDDVAHSLSTTLRDRDKKAIKVTEKLFWGTNPPSMTPPGCWYEPIWTDSDLVRMRQVLSRGLALVQPFIEWV